MTRRLDIVLRTIALLLFLLAVVFYSWNSDDAYHSYIMARHLVEGKGLVYNTGYRVSASTCPLLTLIESFVFLLTSDADLCGLLIGLLFSGAAAWVLFFRLCPSPQAVFCMLGLMVSSRCFMSFTTSGLENPLLFFFGALFFDVYHRDEMLSKRDLFALALLMSLLAMARTDSVLIFAPMAVWACLTRTKVSFSVRMMMSIAGLLPFLLWTLFSLLYYGFPFPNTYYAKLYTGIPLADYVTSGLWYYPNSWLVDPMLLFVPAVFVLKVIKDRCRTLLPLIIGLSAYCLYVVSIGGDFMAGRHLTQQYFLSLCGIAYMLRSRGHIETSDQKKTMAILFVIVAVGFLWNGFVAPIVNATWIDRDLSRSLDHPAIDERNVCLSKSGAKPLFYALGSREHEDNTKDDSLQRFIIKSAYEKGSKGLCFGGMCFQYNVLFGREVYAVSDLDMYLTDAIALQDPLLARLKVDTSRNWRVGHASRKVPRGYHETLASGENRIEDPSLRDYYEKLLQIMKGPIWDGQRLQTIIQMNLGRYDYLLERYYDAPRKMNDLELAFAEVNNNGNPDRALSLLNTCLSKPAVYPRVIVHYCRGCVLEDLTNDLIAAEKEYELAISSGVSFDLVPCADRLARLWASRGELSKAISLWEVAAKIDPDNEAVRWNLSVARRSVERMSHD